MGEGARSPRGAYGDSHIANMITNHYNAATAYTWRHPSE